MTRSEYHRQWRTVLWHGSPWLSYIDHLASALIKNGYLKEDPKPSKKRKRAKAAK